MSGNSSFQLFLASSVGSGLSANGQDELRKSARSINLDRNEALRIDRTCFIAAGDAKLVINLSGGQEHIADFVGHGDFVFERQGETGSLHILALSDCNVLAFPTDDFVRAVSGDAKASEAMLLIMAKQMHMLRLQAARVATLFASERVATFLTAMANKTGESRARDLRVHLPMSRAEIGDHLGLTIETTSRCVSRLKAEGLIACPSRDEIVILDRVALAGFVD